MFGSYFIRRIVVDGFSVCKWGDGDGSVHESLVK